ncbi:hypothetical protein JXB31_00110 [Candidatus Woesearchaeota archaeon]|nr:hypothetical protein [Candidatus Woesearchaeota archaeon]
MNSRKGVSPLIATVLLLAFSVALATVVMQLDPFSDDCSKVNIRIAEYEGQKHICYDEGDRIIKVYVENSEYVIDSVKVSVSGTEGVLVIDDMGIKIARNQLQMLSIPYDISEYGKILDVMITPRVNVSYAVIECPLDEDILSITSCK